MSGYGKFGVRSAGCGVTAFNAALRTPHPARVLRRTTFVLFALGLLVILPACRIGSGFDTAEKRRNLEWNEPIQVTQPEVTEPTPEAVATAKATPPIIYLLVAG